MAIFYYKNHFSNIKSKEARLRGAFVSYEGLTNSIRLLDTRRAAPSWRQSMHGNSVHQSTSSWWWAWKLFDTSRQERLAEVVNTRQALPPPLLQSFAPPWSSATAFAMAWRMPSGRRGNTASAVVSWTTVGFFNPSIK